MHPPQTGTTYGELVAEALRRHGDEPAFLDADDSVTTYAEALDLFGRLRAALAARGVGHGSGVAMLSTNRADGWLTQWAGPANGARYTPLNPYGSLEDLLHVVRDSQVDLLVVDADGYPALGPALAAALDGVTVLTLGPASYGEDLLALAATCEPLTSFDPALHPEDLAMVIYTGGTTGRPKGVMQTHRAIVANHTMQLAEWPWPERPRFLACAPYSHATGWFPLGVLWRGGTVILRKGFAVDTWLDAVERLGASMTFAVPTMVYALLDDPRTAAADTSSLELVMYGAAPMSLPRLRQSIATFGPVFCQLYGQSEAPNVVTTLLPADHDLDDEDRLASCGRAGSGMQVSVLGEDDRVLGPGEVGELCLRGPLVMQGYWNAPEQTAETLRDGWLRTGDLATTDAAGYVRLVGRGKDLIITGGFNVYPAEVEAAVLAHPGVAAVGVVGLPDDRWGERVTAFVVRRPGAEVGADELVAGVRERKGSVMAPKEVRFVDALPLTSLGKPDKKALRAVAAEDDAAAPAAVGGPA